MSENIFIANALQIPSQDLDALAKGQMIVTLPESFLNVGQSFALFSSTEGIDEVEAYFWATCDLCKSIDTYENLKSLASLTVWNQQYLEEKFNKNKFLFLGFLRVYKLPKPVTILVDRQIQFSPLKEPLIFEKNLALLSDRLFAQRKEQIEKLKAPEHPELEELQSAIDCYAKDHPEAQGFSDDLQCFLGWSETKGAISNFPNWVPEITTSGNSSDGYLFEKLVRQSFIQLGFTNNGNDIKASMDPDATGGAGGVDIYCENPFAIAGECKASKNQAVPNKVSSQLNHLGIANLGKTRFDAAVKIIFAAGTLTNHAEKAATEHKMNVMRPETLQRLVELKFAHPGSIDLLELKPCLESAPFGSDADSKITQFIDETWQKLKIRSHIVRSVKALKDDGDHYVTASTVRTYFNATFGQTLGRLEKPENVYSLLIELASPLAGYLGRTQCDARDWRGDRFYFLRDLTV